MYMHGHRTLSLYQMYRSMIKTGCPKCMKSQPSPTVVRMPSPKNVYSVYIGKKKKRQGVRTTYIDPEMISRREYVIRLLVAVFVRGISQAHLDWIEWGTVLNARRVTGFVEYSGVETQSHARYILEMRPIPVATSCKQTISRKPNREGGDGLWQL